MTMTTESAIEAILFFRGEPISIGSLARYIEVSEAEIKEALSALEKSLRGRGIALITEGKTVALGTNREVSSLIEKVVKEELHRDIGKAGLEVLAIVTYKGSASKREIEYIRGVNSSYILRNLMMRGLIEVDEENAKKERSRTYKPTIDLLSHLGISSVSELPEYNAMIQELEATTVSADTTTDE